VPSNLPSLPFQSLEFRIPVIGGHSGETIVPLISQTTPKTSFDQSTLEALVKRIQFGGDEVVKAKDGAGSATLSMAFAGARFATAVLEAASGKTSQHPEYTYVHLSADAGGKEVEASLPGKAEYFSVPVQLGKNGVEKILKLGELSDYEKKLLEVCVDQLGGNVSKGVSFVETSKL
jgi:malate dehydrogenase